MEMVSSLWWTPELPSRFNESRGYDITLCLPYLITAANYWNGAVLPYGEGFVAENATFGDKCNEDYRTTLNEGYQEYLAAYVNWTHGLGVGYSAQPAYNLPLNMVRFALNASEFPQLTRTSLTISRFSTPPKESLSDSATSSTRTANSLVPLISLAFRSSRRSAELSAVRLISKP